MARDVVLDKVSHKRRKKLQRLQKHRSLKNEYCSFLGSACTVSATQPLSALLAIHFMITRFVVQFNFSSPVFFQNLLLIAKVFFASWLDLLLFGRRQESNWFCSSSFAEELWEKTCL